MTAAYNQYLNFKSYLKNVAWQTSVDEPLSLTINKYWNRTALNLSLASNVFKKAKVNQVLQSWAIDNGAELNTMSTWEYDGYFDY